jgi:flavin reductase (DIM6/NTAB) family NADH-FMN oxidoreductase RutF
MTVDTDAAAKVLGGLRPYPVAITTTDGGFANGLMSLSAGAASIIPEAPRATISLTKYNLTHDLVVNSGFFVMHLLSAEEDQVEESLEILMTLGGSSGRDGDKVGKLRTKTGVTGAPILLGAHSYVEARVTGTLDVQESSIFVGDVVAAEILHPGRRLQINEAWSKLPAEWIEQYETNHGPQLENARSRRFAEQG